MTSQSPNGRFPHHANVRRYLVKGQSTWVGATCPRQSFRGSQIGLMAQARPQLGLLCVQRNRAPCQLVWWSVARSRSDKCSMAGSPRRWGANRACRAREPI